MPDVFISYNREDREVAREVAAGLEAEGFSVWYDAALRAGEYYEEVTESNLRSAGAVVVLWSKRSASSKWVRAEATVGERSSILVPALIEECERPVRFELLQTADLTRWHGDRNDPNWRGFVGDVRAAISRRSAPSTQNQTQARAPAPATPSPAARADAANIETTFWNSIKDGTERADFEAYLARYPKGHFADLARNRLAALDRAAGPKTASPLRPAPATAAQKPAQMQPKPRPVAPKAATNPAPTKAKGGLGAIMIAGAVAAIAATGVAAYFMTRAKDPEAQAAASIGATTAKADADEASLPAEAAIESAPAPVTLPGEPPSEPAVDAIADSGAPLAEEPAGSASAEQLAEATPAPVAPTKPSTPAVPAGNTARDCDSCPLMASLPGGVFIMGSPEGEPGRNPYEGPQHEVAIKAFRIGVYEVTVGEWGQCVAAGTCAAKPGSDQNMPVLRVSWNEAKAYARWLSGKTGKSYRLPTETEWEYAARAGTTGAWHWGDRFDATKLARVEVRPVGSFDPNPFGLHDMLSNAREWVEDCYANNFTETPRDGSAARNGDCSVRVVRGGGASSQPNDTRVANRIRNKPGDQIRYMGFRVAAD